ncbi:hypothetical protein [Kitasatospora sp. NPDC090308]|uniref:hypothetical protein n=1 Tax=Kitasatospora sp. NPDC090308 TaxID=3364082 RepID=UPI0038044F99
MEEIPTLFERDGAFRGVDRPRAGCARVFAGEGAAPGEPDGTDVRPTVRSGQLVRVEGRRDPSAAQKRAGVVDGRYADTAEDAAEDRWVLAAARGADACGRPGGEHPGEALGPRIQGNPLELDGHLCLPFDREAPVHEGAPRDHAGPRAYPAGPERRFAPGALAEGVVFHHPDGRRAEVERKGFPESDRARRAPRAVGVARPGQPSIRAASTAQ